MKRLSLDQFVEESFHRSLKMKEQEEIGLFTFYRQQQQKDEERKILTKTQKQEHKKLKPRKKITTQKRISLAHKEKQTGNALNQSYQSFLKNVNIRSLKEKGEATKELSLSYNTADKQIDSSQQQFIGQGIDHRLTSPQINEEINQEQNVSAYNIHLSVSTNKQSQDASEPLIKLKRLEDFLRSSDLQARQKVGEATKPFGGKQGRLTLKIKTQPSYLHYSPIKGLMQPQIVQVNTLQQSHLTSKKKSLQESFLEKVRAPQYISKSKIKRLPNSNVLESIHSANQRYISTLLNNFQLPHHSHNQAAKMLRETFKFPNVMLTHAAFKGQSYSPTRFPLRINNERTTLSCRKRSDSQLGQMIVEGQESIITRNNQKVKRVTRHERLFNKTRTYQGRQSSHIKV